MSTPRYPHLYERGLASLLLAFVVVGTSEISLAQAPLFDHHSVGVPYQPSFLRFQAEAEASSFDPVSNGSATDHPDSSWLNPSPFSGATVASFRPADPAMATGSVGAVQSCPDPLALTASGQTPGKADMKNGQMLGRGRAVWYDLPGRTANGETFDPEGFTAGHRSLPFGTRVRVVNDENGKSVVVRINDRGPKQAKFEIDLSRGSAKVLGISGTATVSLYAIDEDVGSTGSIVQSAQ